MLNNEFENSWRDFHKTINTDLKYKSSMWVDLLKDFDNLNFDQLKDDLLSGREFRGYGFKSMERKNKFLNFILLFFYFLVKVLFSLVQRFWIFKKKFIPSYINEYPLNTIFLKKQNMYIDYIKFCKKLKIDSDSLNSSKCFYVSEIVSRHFVNKSKGQNILEIGGGLGGLAINILEKYNVSKYIIIDFPEMLLHSSICINNFFPEKKIIFVNSKYDFNDEGIYLVPIYNIDSIPNDFINISFNIDSFQEMTSIQIKNYINLVQKKSLNNGIFLNINRRKYLIKENFDNNPLLYPYFKENFVYKWETDIFFDKTSNFLKYRKDPWIIREESIVKSV